MKLSFIGAGRVGTTLAACLYRKGMNIFAVSDKNRKNADRFHQYLPDVTIVENPEAAAKRSEVIFITTNDDSIQGVCTQIAGSLKEDSTVIHTSGLLTTEALSAAQNAGAKLLSFHPLKSFSDIDAAIATLPGTYIALEGDERAIQLGRKLVETLGGKDVVISKEKKALYHTAASIISNFSVTLMHLGMELEEKAGISPATSKQMLISLLDGTLNNLRESDPIQALTGPIERGDEQTIQTHMLALEENFPAAVNIYKILGAFTNKIALEKGSISKETFDIINTILHVD